MYSLSSLSDLSNPHFPGIHARDGGYIGPRPTPELHPNMRLETSVVSIPKVNPGDAVFWHCDVVHAVEQDHIGKGESAGQYHSNDFLRCFALLDLY